MSQDFGNDLCLSREVEQASIGLGQSKSNFFRFRLKVARCMPESCSPTACVPRVNRNDFQITRQPQCSPFMGLSHQRMSPNGSIAKSLIDFIFLSFFLYSGRSCQLKPRVEFVHRQEKSRFLLAIYQLKSIKSRKGVICPLSVQTDVRFCHIQGLDFFYLESVNFSWPILLTACITPSN